LKLFDKTIKTQWGSNGGQTNDQKEKTLDISRVLEWSQQDSKRKLVCFLESTESKNIDFSRVF